MDFAVEWMEKYLVCYEVVDWTSVIIEYGANKLIYNFGYVFVLFVVNRGQGFVV